MYIYKWKIEHLKNFIIGIEIMFVLCFNIILDFNILSIGFSFKIHIPNLHVVVFSYLFIQFILVIFFIKSVSVGFLSYISSISNKRNVPPQMVLFWEIMFVCQN